MSSTTEFESRRERIRALLPEEDANIFQNGYVIPEQPARFLVIEYSEGDPNWAASTDTLEGAAKRIEDSVADDVSVCDLDTNVKYQPVRKVVAFYNGDTRVEIAASPSVQCFQPRQPLPPDPDGMNADRASSAKKTLMMFSTNFGERLVGDSSVEDSLTEQNLIDLIADFGHLCDRQSLDFGGIVSRSAGQYIEETDRKGLQFAWSR